MPFPTKPLPRPSLKLVAQPATDTEYVQPLLGYQHVNHEQFVSFDGPYVSLGEPLIDHTPRRYAVLVWNALVVAATGGPSGD